MVLRAASGCWGLKGESCRKGEEEGGGAAAAWKAVRVCSDFGAQHLIVARTPSRASKSWMESGRRAVSWEGGDIAGGEPLDWWVSSRVAGGGCGEAETIHNDADERNTRRMTEAKEFKKLTGMCGRQTRIRHAGSVSTLR